MTKQSFDDVLFEFCGYYTENSRLVEDLDLDSLEMTGLLQEMEFNLGKAPDCKSNPRTVAELRLAFGETKR